MYKLFITLNIVLIVAIEGLNAQSQKGDFDVTLGYGILSVPRMEDFAISVIGEAVTLGTRSTKNIDRSGVFSVFGHYQISNKVKIGVGSTFEREKSEAWAKSSGNEKKIGDAEIQHLCVMPSCTYAYINKSRFQLYSNLAMGVGFKKESFTADSSSGLADESNSTTRFAFQISPIGFRVGQKLSFFGELGFGYKGLLQSGLSYRF